MQKSTLRIGVRVRIRQPNSMGWDGRITRIQVWTSTVGTSLVQEASLNFQKGLQGAGWFIHKQKQNKCNQNYAKGWVPPPLKIFNQFHKSAIVWFNMFNYISHSKCLFRHAFQQKSKWCMLTMINIVMSVTNLLTVI